MTTVSVVVPTFNRGALVEHAVRSILTQTYSDFEVIIVDDGSTDDTSLRLDSLASADSRVRCLYHTTNRGAQAARNTGCLAAQGKYIAFLDSDNTWLAEKLTLQVEVFEQSDNQLGAVYCGFRVIYPDTSHFDMIPQHRGDVYPTALGQWLADTSTLVVREDVLRKAGYWDERIRAYQEWDMCIRLAQIANFDFVPQLLTLYYRHSQDRISGDRFLNALGHLDVIEAHRHEVIRHCGAKALADHYFKASKQFAYEARHNDWAIRAVLRCLRAYPLRFDAYRLLFQLLLTRNQRHSAAIASNVP